MTSTTELLDAGQASAPELARQINELVQAAEERARGALQSALEAGLLLNQAKAQIPHGKWNDWLQAHCVVAPRTARSYMRLATTYPKLLDELQGDLTRNFVKENITGPLAGMLGDTLGFSLGGASGAKLGTQANPMYVKMTESLGSLMSGAPSGSSGGWMSSLFGAAGSLFGGFSTGTGASIASALPGDSMDNFLKLMGNFGGARANGGPVSPFSLYKVNERGPEMFQMDDGTQLLMTGARGGGITPNHMLGGSGAVYNTTINVPQQTSRATGSQIAAEMQRKLSQGRRNM